MLITGAELLYQTPLLLTVLSNLQTVKLSQEERQLTHPLMPLTPSIIMSPAAMGAPMTCDKAVLVATIASAGPVSSAEWNTVMWTHIPGKVPASTIPKNSLCTCQDGQLVLRQWAKRLEICQNKL